MRVALIDFSPYTEAVTPISLGYLGAVLRAHGHQATVLSLGVSSSFSVASFSSWLRTTAPQLVGLATYQRNFLHVRGLARLIKEIVPQCRTVLGGPQALFLPEEAMAFLPEVDFVCRGEGEPVIAAIAQAIAAGEPQAAVPGTITRLPGGEWQSAPPPDAPLDLDAYPSPWLDGTLDPTSFQEAVMLSSRGCPHRCVFCITPAASVRRCRYHSTERVLEEIAYVADRGCRRLWFADPNFCCHGERVFEILEGIIRRDLRASMWLESRADLIDDELLDLMKRAGVETLAMGLESASPVVTSGLAKRCDPQQVGEAARRALAAGLRVELFSQYALPGESLDNAMTTLERVKAWGVPISGNSNAQQMQLYFGSEISNAPHAFGIRPLHEPPPYLSIGANFETEWMSRHEIASVRKAWRAASLDGGKGIVS